MMRACPLLLLVMHLSGVAAQAPFALCYDNQSSGVLSPWIPIVTQLVSNELLVAWPGSAYLSDSLNVLHLSPDGQPLNAYQLRRTGSNFLVRRSTGAPDSSILYAGSASGGHLLVRTSPAGVPLSAKTYTVSTGVSTLLRNVARANADGTVCSAWGHSDDTFGQGSIIMKTDASGGINWVFKIRVDDEPSELRTIVPLANNKLLLLGSNGSTVDGINTIHSAMVVVNDQGDVLWAQRLQADNAEHISIMGAVQLPDGTLLVGGSHGMEFGAPTYPVVMAFDADGGFLWGTEYQPNLPSQHHLGPTQVLAEGDSALIFLGLSLDATNVFLLRVGSDGLVVHAQEQPAGTSYAAVDPVNGIYYTLRDTSSSGISIPCLFHPDAQGVSCALPAVEMNAIPFVPNIHPGWLPITVDVGVEDISDQFQLQQRPLPLAVDQCHGLPTAIPEPVGNTFIVVPNPASSVLSIVGAPVQRVIVVDASGRYLMERSFLHAQAIEIAVEELQPGMYLALLQSGDGHHVVRFVKQ